MIDLMSLLSPPTATPGAPALPGFALGREEAGFDAVLDQVVAQIASLLVPVAPLTAPVPLPVDQPTDEQATPSFAARDGGHPADVAAVHPHVVPANTKAAISECAQPTPFDNARLPDDDSPAPVTVDPNAAFVAVVRAGLGLQAAAAKVDAPDPKAVPERAVAVGRTGVMPTLPEHAHAAVSTPPGVAGRVPSPAPPVVPAVDAPVLTEPPVSPSTGALDVVAPVGAPPTMDAPATVVPEAVAPTPEATAPDAVAPDFVADVVAPDAVAPDFVADVVAPATSPPIGAAPADPSAELVARPVAPDAVVAVSATPDVAVSRLVVPPMVPVNAPVATTAARPAAPNRAPVVSPDDTGRARLVDGTPAPPDFADRVQAAVLQSVRDARTVADGVVTRDAPQLRQRGVPAPAEVAVAAPEPDVPNDIAVPDVPPTGVPVDEDAPAIANAEHTPLPVFDAAPPTQEERLSAIAPPLISEAEDPADKNDTSDTIVAPHDDAPPHPPSDMRLASGEPPQAAAVHAADNTARPERAQRQERAERIHANGLAEPLRVALRERQSQREDNFTLTVRLDPPELGVVHVRVSTSGEHVKITLQAENPEARAVLQQRHDDVRDLLRNEGFNLDGFDVESHDERRQSNDQPNRRRAAATTPAADFAAPSFEDDGALRL